MGRTKGEKKGDCTQPPSADELRSWYDELLLTKGEEPEDLAAQESRRCQKLAGIAGWAGIIPRRLGGDATAEELKADKKFCRKVSHMALQMDKLWNPSGEYVNLLEVDTRLAATIDWGSWPSNHKHLLHMRMIYVSTWAYKHDHVQEGRQFLHRLQTELDEVNRIFG